MERNLRLYPLYQAARGLVFWIPVFFLYFSSLLAAHEVVLLEAIYYLAAVTLEVPSGYFSDRVGRRLTLILATCAGAAGYLTFAVTGSFAAFVGAQVLVAVSFTFNSGTDGSLLYDSLLALDRADELGDREARAQSWHLGALAVASLIGGVLAGFELRWAYLLSALGSLIGLGVVLALREPPRGAPPPAPLRQLRAVGERLRDPTLRWVFAFMVGLVVLAHVPYEFFQPYLELLFAEHDLDGYAVTPAIAGGAVAATMGCSAWASRYAMTVRRRLGAPVALLGVLFLQGLLIAVMAGVLHGAVLALFVLRSVPAAVAYPVASAIVHPRVSSSLRATYLSVQSLAGRLAFSGTLALAAWALAGEGARLGPAGLSRILGAFAVLAALLVTGLALGAPGFRRALGEEAA